MRAILGYIILIFVLLGLLALTAYSVGIVIASLIWFVGLSVVSLLYLAVYLITG